MSHFAFLFPGQGSQFAGVGTQYRQTFGRPMFVSTEKGDLTGGMAHGTCAIAADPAAANAALQSVP